LVVRAASKRFEWNTIREMVVAWLHVFTCFETAAALLARDVSPKRRALNPVSDNLGAKIGN
jgi:hypothetical protein